MDMYMGTLKPGATYVYERDGNRVYAREFGGTDRQLVGYDYDGSGTDLESGLEKFKHEVLWTEILKAAEVSPALQEALDRVKVIYQLIKDNNDR
jgi:hypothetical protein